MQAVKGTRDILPQDTPQWRAVERMFHDICARFAYEEIRIPTFEYTEVFQRGVGETTDIVQKEMYTFEDRGGRSLTLRPEATAGVVRAFVEHGMGSLAFPVRLQYRISSFRAENVQSGRYREFFQLGVEAFGSEGPEIDAEQILLVQLFLERLGLTGFRAHVSSIGCKECRAEYHKLLKEYLEPHLDELCDDCQRRFHTNPLRILDCKEERCIKVTKDAPLMADHLDEDCEQHLHKVLDTLDRLEVPYLFDKRIVRGLDYYSRTVFEFILESEEGAQRGTLCGGGRYDHLVVQLGGPDVPGIGFSIGEDRLLMALEEQGIVLAEATGPRLFIVTMDEDGSKAAQEILWGLRQRGISAVQELTGRSFKAQMKQVNRSGAAYSLVLGDDELKTRRAKLRNLRDRDAEDIEVSLDEMDELAHRLEA